MEVEPKAFDLILLLAERSDRVVTRDELIEVLWQGRVISDAALSTCIKAARRAIGDTGRLQRLIRTYPRRGLRFVGTVATVGRSSASQAASPVQAMSTEVAKAPNPGAAIELELQEGPSIAVLPFELVGSGDDHWGIAHGLARDITTRLGRAHWLFVISRGSAFQFRPDAVHEIGTALAVRYVLQGSTQSTTRRVRVNVALIDTARRLEVWSELFDRNIGDVFLIQEEITEAIVTSVQSHIEQNERKRALLKPMASLDAWSAYHRGWWHMDRHSPGDYAQAETCFKLATRLDPSAARAFAGLSAVHRQRAFLNLTTTRQNDVRRALELAQQSLSLDHADPQAHWAMGRALMLQDDVPAALTEFETANMLNPSFAMSQYSVGFGRSMIGEAATSDQALLRSLRLSPIDPMRFAMLATRAFNAALSGNLADAADLATLAAAQPNAHLHILAIASVCNALAGRADAADGFAQRLRRLRSEYTSADFFRAFPFRTRASVELWRKGFRLIGLR
ncbi:MAG: winged helix-turn-helix domain-containing protein [Hyphomicrobiaceae bacterium]